MSKEKDGEQKLVKCCVMNCQNEIPIEKAIKVGNKYFCRICGVAYYRTNLNL
ncbi:MAG: hypothetical protein ACFFA0_15250 [Promethearchaeota archaeon]